MSNYSVYIPTKNRVEKSFTADILLENNIPFYLVVEPQDQEKYSLKFGAEKILVIPENNQGISYIRNWIKKYSIDKGEKFHWQIDDNIRNFKQRINNKNIKCSPVQLLESAENFLNKYQNIGALGLKHVAWAFKCKTELSINQQVYSCVLINNNIDVWWRNNVVEDCDYSLQILSKGFCTVLFNTFLIDKANTMQMKGGNTEIEYGNNGRMRRAIGMQKAWPDIFDIKEINGVVSLKPSRIWRTFTQKLMPNES